LAALHESTAAFRVFGDDLVPVEITRLLGVEPTTCHSKGDKNVGENGREFAPYKSGLWLLDAGWEIPGNLDRQASDLLARMTPDLGTWHRLGARFGLDLCCGLGLALRNEGLALSPATLQALGERGIELQLDIYSPSEEPSPADPCPCFSGETYAECHGYRGT
jgi:hypothetical protein